MSATLHVSVILILTAVSLPSSLQLNPGAKFRATQKGLDYAGRVAVDKMTAMFKGVNLPDLRDGDNSVTGNRVTSLSRPSSRATVNGGITWSLNNIDVTVEGNWRFCFRLMWWNICNWGNYRSWSSGSSLSVAMTLGKSSDGKPTIASTGCSINLSNFEISIGGTWWDWLYTFIVGFFKGDIRNKIQSGVCDAARKAVDTNGAQALAAVQMVIPFQDIYQFDYTLTSAPVIGNGFIDFPVKAAFSKTNPAGSSNISRPNPPQNIPTTNTDKMMALFMSEYPINTIGHALYHQGLFRFEGTIGVPEFLTQMPSVSALGVSLYTTRPPTATISESHAVTGNFYGVANITAQLTTGSVVPIAVLVVDINLSVTAQFNGKLITAMATSSRLSVNVQSTGMGFTISNTMATIVANSIMSTIVIPNLNTVGSQGFPVPSLQDITFRDVSVQYKNDVAMLSTDVSHP